MPANTGFQFFIQNYDGTSSNTKVDMADMFVGKDSWYNSGLQSAGYTYGNGTTIGYSSPIQIGSLTNWKQISVNPQAGGSAVKTDGTLWAWGFGGYSQIGNGTTISYSSPIQIGELTNWKQVSCGFYDTAAIKTDGTLWTWGYNDSGQAGNGTTISYSSPIQIGALTNWKQVSSSLQLSAAIKTDGTLWTWGLNDVGQLGYEVGVFGRTNVASPVLVAGGTTWATTDPTTYLLNSSGNRGFDNASYFITSTNQLWVCGQNEFGQLGTSNRTYFSSPIQVGSLTNWKQIGAGNRHALALKTDGTLWAWGANVYGQLGRGNTVDYSSPIQIGSLTNWNQVSSGIYFSAAIKTDGTLWAWGQNSEGQLGNGATSHYSSPIQVGSLTNWSKIAAGGDFWTAIKTDGTLWASGYNGFGELGIQSNNNMYSSPVQIGSLTSWTYISSGANHSLALRNNGTLWAWGYNGYGQLGNGTTSHYSSPIQVGSLTTWKHICSGKYYSAAIKTDGTLWTWGYNNGNLGNNVFTPHYSSPIQVGSLTNWTQVVCGYDTTYAYTTNSVIYSWGRNSYGQLGAPSTLLGKTSSPVQVGSLTNWKQVSGASTSAQIAAVKNDGTLWTWGQNTNGELGNGTTINYSSPIQIGSLTNWKQVSPANQFTAAVKNDGTLWTWGRGDYGNLGNGTTLKYSSPIQVGSLTNWKQVEAGWYSIAANKTDGTLWTCGYNNIGQLGNGTRTDYSSPIQIGSLTIWKQAEIDRYTLIAIQAPELELAKYAPGAPTDVIITNINTTAVSVLFSAPTYNGNDPITSYEVSY